MEGLAKAFGPHLRPGAVVTDAASVKQSVVASLEGVLGGCAVGAHPMAGSEKSGFSAARENLFENALCVLTPTPCTAPEALATARDLWAAAGCRLTEMSPVEHDRTVARVSHLPHAAAAAVVRAAALAGPNWREVAATGYRDTTRVAAGASALWKEILLDNRAEIVAGIDDMQNSLKELKEALLHADGDAIAAWLEEARLLRDSLPPQR
jgi:prephenate dehydrogenase